MKNAKSNTVKVCLAIAAIVVIDVTAALAQSSSRSRYSYQYSVPSDSEAHWPRKSTSRVALIAVIRGSRPMLRESFV